VLDLTRSLFEAWLLYTFYRVILALLGGEHKALVLASKEVPRKLLASPPLCFLICCTKKSTLTKKLFKLSKYTVLQLCIVRPILFVVGLCLQFNGLYVPGVLNYKQGYPYVATLSTISAFTCLYGLFVIYRATHATLHEHKTTFKFVTVKLLILLGASQSIILSILVRLNVFKSTDLFPAHTKAEAWTNFLLTIESAIIAVLMNMAFPIEDYAILDNRLGHVTLTESLSMDDE